MREILFRGKRKDNGEWIEGFAYEHEAPLTCFANDPKEKSKWYIVRTAFADWGLPRKVEMIEVVPETLGQFVGKTDKNGVKIFEGDIVSYNNSHEVVRWNTEIVPCFCLGIGGGSSTAFHPYKISKRHVVVGNVHDNPELLGA